MGKGSKKQFSRKNTHPQNPLPKPQKVSDPRVMFWGYFSVMKIFVKNLFLGEDEEG